jgi:hypothetical protein
MRSGIAANTEGIGMVQVAELAKETTLTSNTNINVAGKGDFFWHATLQSQRNSGLKVGFFSSTRRAEQQINKWRFD